MQSPDTITALTTALPGYRAVFAYRDINNEVDVGEEPVLAWATLAGLPLLAIPMVFDQSAGGLIPAADADNFLQVLAPGQWVDRQLLDEARQLVARLDADAPKKSSN